MKRLPSFCLILSLALLASCSHSSRKPKDNPALATEVEESFRQRFIEKRSADLMALGLRADLARQQAIDEYNARYGYTHAANK